MSKSTTQLSDARKTIRHKQSGRFIVTEYETPQSEVQSPARSRRKSSATRRQSEVSFGDGAHPLRVLVRPSNYLYCNDLSQSFWRFREICMVS